MCHHSRPFVNSFLLLVAQELLLRVTSGSYISCPTLLNLINYAA
jgi:hypothetical protein